MNYIGLSTCDTSNGTGCRVSLFVSGCTLHCKGCFNEDSWDFNAGKPFTQDTVNTILTALQEPYIAGLSILGGDPFETSNMPHVLNLLEQFRQIFGKSKSVYIWTGRKYEKLILDPTAQKIIDLCDVIIDGPFIEHLKVPPHEHCYYGSTNQRVLILPR